MSLTFWIETGPTQSRQPEFQPQPQPTDERRERGRERTWTSLPSTSCSNHSVISMPVVGQGEVRSVSLRDRADEPKERGWTHSRPCGGCSCCRSGGALGRPRPGGTRLEERGRRGTARRGRRLDRSSSWTGGVGGEGGRRGGRSEVGRRRAQRELVRRGGGCDGSRRGARGLSCKVEKGGGGVERACRPRDGGRVAWREKRAPDWGGGRRKGPVAASPSASAPCPAAAPCPSGGRCVDSSASCVGASADGRGRFSRAPVERQDRAPIALPARTELVRPTTTTTTGCEERRARALQRRQEVIKGGRLRWV